MIDEQKIEQLLDAFYNGVTTCEEEKILADFFKGKDSCEKWQTDRDLFYALYDPNRIPLPKGFSVKLEIAVNNHIMQSVHSQSYTITRKLFIGLLSATAVILLCIGLFLSPLKGKNKNFIADTYTSPEEAAIVAEKALFFISAKLNEGLAPLEKVKESVIITNEVLNENFK